MSVVAGSNSLYKEQIEFEADRRSFTDLWNEAQQKFASIAGDHVKFANTRAILDYGTEQMNNFHHFRHDQTRVDRIRTLFQSNMSHIETGTAAIANAASGAFPPAAVIGTAIAFVLGACRQVSADYDLITGFFEDMNSFLDRVTIFEKRIPVSKPYQNCLVEVFGSLLEMCACAGTEIKKRRLKKWLLKMLSHDDPGLDEAKKNMDIALSRLQSATEFAILNNTEELLKLNQELLQNQERHNELVNAQTAIMQSGFQSMDSVMQRIVMLLQKQEGSRNNATLTSGKVEIATTRKIENFLNFRLSVLEHVTNEARDVFVNGTCQWMFEEPAWQAWLSHNKTSSNVLVVAGNRGSGKTHLAISAYESLRTSARSSTNTASNCVGCVLFRDRVEDLQDMYSAMAAITIQIAQQNSTICEQINRTMASQKNNKDDKKDNKKDNDLSGWRNIWTKCIAANFQKESPWYLQLIFDGVDELTTSQMDEFLSFVGMLNQTPSTQISVVIMIRTVHLSKFRDIASGVISAETRKQKNDYDAIIQNRVNASRRLRNLDDDIKQQMVQRLKSVSDSILYVEYMLQSFKTFERRSSLLKQLKTAMPPDLDSIFLVLLSDYEKRLAKGQLEAARIVLMWVAFAYVHPTLDEITALLAHTKHQEFQLEEELQQSQLRRFLVMRKGTQKKQSALEYDGNPFETVQDDNYDNNSQNDSTLVHFWDRSMREFFRALTQNESGLRTVESEAHRRCFIICSEILQNSSKTRTDLLKYASKYWLAHHYSVRFDDHSHLEQVEFLEATALLLHDASHLPDNLVAADTDFFEIRECLGKCDDALLSIKTCVDKSTSKHLADLSQVARSWFDHVKATSQNVFLSVAQGLIRQWLRTEDIMQMYKPYWFVRSCAIVACLPPFDDTASSQSDLSKRTYMNFVSPLIPCGERNDYFLDHSEIKNIIDLLPEKLTLEAQTVLYRTLVEKSNQLLDPTDFFLDIFDQLPSSNQQALSKAKIALAMGLRQVANLTGINDPSWFRERAVGEIGECFNDGTMPDPLLALAYALLADLKFQLNLEDDGLLAHAKVHEFSGEEFVDAKTIKNELRRTRLCRKEEVAANLVRNWTMAEALAYMTSDYYKAETYHMALRRMASAVSDREFLIRRYQDVIQVLERLQAAAPIQIELATCYQYVYKDIAAAKKTLDQVLDGVAKGGFYALTNEEPEWALGQAVNKMSDILYEEFRATPDPKLKLKLFGSTEGLLSRKLTEYVNVSASTLLHHTITRARMLKRLGPAQEFQKVLDQAFQTCLESLRDSVGWNDRTSLIDLCKILALLDGFGDEMAIAVSARFSDLEHYDEPTSDGVNEKTQDDGLKHYEYPDIKGGYVTGERSFCDGSICSPNRVFQDFESLELYDCLICSSCFLCGKCYQKRQEWNEAEAKNDEPNKASNSNKVLYCGLNHRYVKGPMVGWRGVVSGIMYIDGRPPIIFTEWLKQLELEKWPKAWERFWLAEDMVG